MSLAETLGPLADDLDSVLVTDILQPRGNEPLRAVLLVESPHVEEVKPCCRHPLAGDAGVNITAALEKYVPNFIEGYRTHTVHDDLWPHIAHRVPIGCLLASQTRHPVLDGLGLMNVSPLPLQRKPYANVREGDDLNMLLQGFAAIKDWFERGHRGPNPSNSEPDKIDTPLYDAILGDLCERLQALTCSVFPCGLFARNFLCRAENREPDHQWSVEEVSVSHPSKWFQNPQEEIRQFIARIVAPPVVG